MGNIAHDCGEKTLAHVGPDWGWVVINNHKKLLKITCQLIGMEKQSQILIIHKTTRRQRLSLIWWLLKKPFIFFS